MCMINYLVFTIFQAKNCGVRWVSIILHIFAFRFCCCCCCYWPPVLEVCPDYEVVEVQHWILTTLDLWSFDYCYVAYLLDLPHSHLLPSNVPTPQPSSFTASTTGSSAQLGFPRLCPSISKKPLPPFSHHYYPRLNPPPLPRTRHSCCIPVATTPSMLPKYLSTCTPVIDP